MIQANTISPGVLSLKFPARTTATDMNAIWDSVRAELKVADHIKRVIFDLSAAHPVNNAVGRIWDLACFVEKKENVRIVFVVPHGIYSDLHSTDPDLPKDIPTTEPNQGIIILPAEDIALAAAATQSSKNNPKRSVLLSCEAKVRRIEGKQVIVSLFTNDGEVMGTLHRSQFPASTRKLALGAMFRYDAVIVNAGSTEIQITEIKEQALSHDEFLDVWTKVSTDFPEKYW